MKFSIFLFILSLSSALIAADNDPCGPIITDFDADKFSGFWYYVMKTPNKYEKSYNCSNILLYPSSDTIMDIALCEKVDHDYQCLALKGEHHGSQGVMKITDENRRKFFRGSSVNYVTF